MTAPLLRVRELVKHFPLRGGVLGREVGRVHAVDGVSFELAAGETLGLVGESGCASPPRRCILRLIEPTSGSVWFGEREVTALDRRSLRLLARTCSISSRTLRLAQSRMTVGRIIAEALLTTTWPDAAQLDERIVELPRSWDARGPPPPLPARILRGQRRGSASRARWPSPRLIVCDSVSALDVSIQAQVINRSRTCRSSSSSLSVHRHDLSVVEHISTRIAVMTSARSSSCRRPRTSTVPQDPYTEALVSAVPIPDPTVKRRRILLRARPKPDPPALGLPLPTRCPIRVAMCSEHEPPLKQAATAAGSPHLRS